MQESPDRRSRRLARLKLAAAYVGQSRVTFWRHARLGIWPKPIDVGGIQMVDLDELDARIEAMKAARDGEAA